MYVWEFPVRLTHWLNVLAIIVLSFTGFYIGNPFIQPPPGEAFLMATIRFIHFVAAYVFTLSCLLRSLLVFCWERVFPVEAIFPRYGQKAEGDTGTM